MARQARHAPGGYVYHVINRSAARFPMLKTEKDHLAFEETLAEALRKHPTRLLAWCAMDNHWHFAVWPRHDGELSAFFRWLTLTHAMRWRVAHHSVGYGPLYQGRFKSFPIQQDHALTLICRYMERNAKSAGLVDQAEDWRWGSLYVRERGTESQKALLSPWPIAMPADWKRIVNSVMTPRELERIEKSMARGIPFGDPKWVQQTVKRLGLQHTMRREGRPQKEVDKN